MSTHLVSRRSFIQYLGATAAACSLGSPARADSRPNVVVIVADDMGWRDPGCYGSTFYETPVLDGLARDGCRFTSAYSAAAVCSPTRASLLTGNYPARVGITQYIGGSQKPTPYKTNLGDELTLGDVFRQNGYATGYVGKWHLCASDNENVHGPKQHGFTYAIGNNGSMPRYFPPHRNFWRQQEPPTIHLPPTAGEEYLTDRLTDKALGFIEQNASQPFLLYLAFYNPHTPIEAREKLVEKYEEKARAMGIDKPGQSMFAPEPIGDTVTRQIQNNPVYAAMIEILDANVGRMLQKLETEGIAKNTIVVFLSDNGGLSCYGARPTSNAPLRAGKGWLYEGGIRIPFMVRAPSVTHGRVQNTPVITTDLFPTLMELAGVAPPEDQHRDGLSLVPLLRGDSSWKRDDLFWHCPHTYPNPVPCSAIRKANYKLIEYLQNGRCELYDLKEDIGETRDLAELMPGQCEAMRTALRQWRDRVGANMPQ